MFLADHGFPGGPGARRPLCRPGDMLHDAAPGRPGPGFGPRMRRGRRIRRGDVRAAILLLVEEEPRNGYQIMQELESRSGGAGARAPARSTPHSSCSPTRD